MRPDSRPLYIPTLSVRPAEVRAYSELPETTKDDILPLFLLRPWLSAHDLQAARDRIIECVGQRPFFLDVDDFYSKLSDRPANHDFHSIKNGHGNYNAWIEEVRNFPNAIPMLKINEDGNFGPQLDAFAELGRGVGIRIRGTDTPKLDKIHEAISAALLTTPVSINIDLGDKFNKEFQELGARNIAERYLHEDRLSSVTFTATSFPHTLKGVDRAEIVERTEFTNLQSYFQSPKLIFGDRGSSRLPSDSGGGGAPAPRVDYPTANEWVIFRQEAEDIDRHSAYQLACSRAIQSDDWNSEVRIWGTQAIERTSVGEDDIRSPASSTAARINIHLHIQRSYGDESLLLATDDDYID